MPMWLQRVLGLAVIGSLLFVAASARGAAAPANDDATAAAGGGAAADNAARDEAKRHFASGTVHYGRADYEAALDEFAMAYAAMNHPAFLFNIGQCYRKLGQCDSAVLYFERYVRELPKAPNAAEVRAAIDDCKQLLEEAARAPKAAAPAPGEAAAAPAAPPSPSAAMGDKASEVQAASTIEASAAPVTAVAPATAPTTAPTTAAAPARAPAATGVAAAASPESVAAPSSGPSVGLAAPTASGGEGAAKPMLTTGVVSAPPPAPFVAPAADGQSSATASVTSPFYTRWWFWAAVGGALAVAGGATAIALSGPSDSKRLPAGSLGTIDLRAP